jgi:hypothetical protein
MELSLPKLNIPSPDTPFNVIDTGRDVSKLKGRESLNSTPHSTQLPNSWRRFKDRSEYNSSELTSSLDNEDSNEEELLTTFAHWDEKVKEGETEGRKVGFIDRDGESVGYRLKPARIGVRVGNKDGWWVGMRDGKGVGRW